MGEDRRSLGNRYFDDVSRFCLYPYREIVDLVRAAGGKVCACRFPFYPLGWTASEPGGATPGAIPRLFGTTLVIEAVRPP